MNEIYRMNGIKHQEVRPFLSVLVFCLLLGISGQGRTESNPNYESLARSIASISQKTPGNTIVGVAVMDVVSGQVIYEMNGKQPLNPASNIKIVTAAAGLKLLGPEYRFITDIHGRFENGRIQGPLYLKGSADPMLSTAHLREMAHTLKNLGVRRVDGGIVVDDSFFDDENMPYAFDQQPNEDNRFRAPVGAVSLNMNAVGIQIHPGSAAMSRAQVVVDPSEYAIVVNDTLTTAGGAASPRISASPSGDRTRLRIWGQIPLGTRPVWYYRRIDNPSLFSGYGLKGALKDAGIAVGDDIRTGGVPSGTPLLARTTSEPLSAILWHTGKMSNNFVSEMVFKTIGSTVVNARVTWKHAVDSVETLLETWGIEKGTYELRNGSGLFDANRFSALQFCAVLRAAYLDVGIRPEFLTQLATGGVDGTIQSRFTEKNARRRVRAKTGTLNAVSTLSGYVLDDSGQQVIAFSILVNNAAGYLSGARAYSEKIVMTIATHLGP